MSEYVPKYTPEMLREADIEAAAYVMRKVSAKLAAKAAEIKQLEEIVEAQAAEIKQLREQIDAYRWVTPGLLIDSRTAARIIIEAETEAAWRERETQRQTEMLADIV
ncbi:MAG: hypothetical protein ABFD96_03325 [Armatimonadia bacterium]